MSRCRRPTHGERCLLAFYYSELVQQRGLEQAAELTGVTPGRLRLWYFTSRRVPNRLVHELIDRLRRVRSGHVVSAPVVSWPAAGGAA